MPRLPREWLHQTTNLEKSRNRYLDSLTGIRELADFADNNLPESTRARHSIWIRYLTPYRDNEPTAQGLTRTLKEIADNFTGETIELHELFAQALARYKDSFPPGSDTSILDDILVFRKPRERLDLLLTSLLVAAVSDFEVLFSSVVFYLYRLRPEALRAQNPKITWTEIETYRSIEDIKTHFIEERVAQLMWGGFDDWMNWLSAQLKISYPDITLADTAEVFQRRHVIVHNGGEVSSQYLAKVPCSLSPGDPLPVAPEYLANALDKLTVLGVLAVYLTMRKLSGTRAQHEDVDHDIRRVIHELIEDKHWEAAGKTISIALPGIVHPEEQECIRVYKWIAQKELHGTSAVRAEVEQWDCAENHYKLMKKILLDDPDAVEYARNLAAAGTVNVGVISTWPVLGDFWKDATGSKLGVKIGLSSPGGSARELRRSAR